MSNLPVTVDKAVQQVNIQRYLLIDEKAFEAIEDAFEHYKVVDDDKELRKTRMKIVLLVIEKRMPAVDTREPKEDSDSDLLKQIHDYITANEVQSVAETIKEHVVKEVVVTDVEYFRTDQEGQEALKSFLGVQDEDSN